MKPTTWANIIRYGFYLIATYFIIFWPTLWWQTMVALGATVVLAVPVFLVCASLEESSDMVDD